MDWFLNCTRGLEPVGKTQSPDITGFYIALRREAYARHREVSCRAAQLTAEAAASARRQDGNVPKATTGAHC